MFHTINTNGTLKTTIDAVTASSFINGGFAYTSAGALHVVIAGATLSDVFYNGGIATTAKGAMYVTPDTPAASAVMNGGVLCRADGAVHIGVSSGYFAAGMPVSASGVVYIDPRDTANGYLPLLHTVVPNRGSLTPSFTRATTATVLGYAPTANAADGLTLLTAASNEARFVGARRISEGVWSNTFADGSAIPSTTLKGYLPEQAATQLIATTADIRDMTTASWVLGATMTRARTSIGIDGAANSATRLTGGAVAGTNTILYTLVAAASARVYSCYMKRITGTGAVNLQQGATVTDISGSLVLNQWVLVQLSASVLNSAFGVSIATNGDAVDVDTNQFEANTAGQGASSRILTGGGTRNADLLTYTGAEIANYKAMACTFSRGVGPAGTGMAVALSDNTVNTYIGLYLSNATTAQFSGVAATAIQWNQTASNAYTPGANSKMSQTWATNNIKMDKDATAQTPDTVATVPAGTQINVGHLAGSFVLNGPVGEIYLWNRNLSQSELGAVDR